MPTTVQMPDGVSLEFPDGMSHEEIRTAIRSKYVQSKPAVPVDESVGSEKVAPEGMAALERKSDLFALQKKARLAGEYWAGVERRASEISQLAEEEQSPLRAALNSAVNLVDTTLKAVGILPKTGPEPAKLPATFITPEQGTKAARFFSPNPPASEGSAGQGVEEFVGETISALSGVDPALQMAAGKYIPGAAPVVAKSFAGQMAAAIPTAAERLAEARGAKETTKAALETALTVGGPVLIGAGLAKEVPRTPKPIEESATRIGPATAEEVKQSAVEIPKQAEAKNASSIEKTGEVHEDVRTQPVSSEGEVSVKSSGEGIQPLQGSVNAPELAGSAQGPVRGEVAPPTQVKVGKRNAKSLFQKASEAVGPNDTDAVVFHFGEDSVSDVALSSSGDSLRYVDPEKARSTGTIKGGTIGTVHQDFVNWLMSDKALNPEFDANTQAAIAKMRKAVGVTESTKQGIEKAAENVAQVASNEGKRSAKDIKEELVSELQDKLQKAPSDLSEVPKEQHTVTVSIPDDGTFTVKNTVEALTETFDRAKKIKTDTGKPTGVSKKAIKSSSAILAKQSPLPVGPGAARISDIGSAKSDMTQLAESMENVASPKKTITERVEEARATVRSITDEAPSTVRERIAAGAQRLQAIASSIKSGLSKLPEFTNFKRILGQWDGANQIADHELRRFVRTINRNIPKDRQVAMTNWIQADGDATLLRQRADATQSAKLRKGYEDALTLSHDEKIAADNIRSYLDARLQAGIDAGILTEGIENYITQIWKRPNPVTQKLNTDIAIGQLQPNFRYARQRVFESYFEGEQQGFVPGNKSVSALIAAYDQSFNRAIAARGFIKNLTQGTASDGRPLVEVSGSGRPVGGDEAVPDVILIKPKSKPEELAGYRNIDHPALRKWKWVGKTPEGTDLMLEGQLLVHPEIYSHLRNVLSRSAWKTNPIGKTVLGVERGIKELMFTASGFHQVQETLHALGHRVNPFNLEKVDFNQPWQKEAVEHGLQAASYNAMELFTEGLTSGSVVSKIPVIGTRILGPYTEWLFQDYIPRLKMTMYKHALERNFERYDSDLKSGKINRDQLVEMTAKQANAAFGELNYKYIGRNPNLQDALRAFLIAPDFLEARAKFVGQAGKGYGREQLMALGLLAATQYISARLLNQMFDDDPHWDKPFKLIVKKHEYELRTVPGDLVHLVSDPKKFATSRISPFLRSAVEFITGRDYRGVKRDALEQVKDFASLPVPISLRLRDDQRLWETFLNAFGVHERSYTASQEIHDLAVKFREAIKGKPEVEIIQSEDSPYRKLRLALDRGSESTALSALAELRKTHKDSDISRTMAANRKSGFTGLSKAEEAKFKQTLSPPELQRYNEAMAEKSERYTKFQAIWRKRNQ